jgi:hypothetical protein
MNPRPETPSPGIGHFCGLLGICLWVERRAKRGKGICFDAWRTASPPLARAEFRRNQSGRSKRKSLVGGKSEIELLDHLTYRQSDLY